MSEDASAYVKELLNSIKDTLDSVEGYLKLYVNTSRLHLDRHDRETVYYCEKRVNEAAALIKNLDNYMERHRVNKDTYFRQISALEGQITFLQGLAQQFYEKYKEPVFKVLLSEATSVASLLKNLLS